MSHLIYQQTTIASGSLGRNVLRKRGPSGVTKIKCHKQKQNQKIKSDFWWTILGTYICTLEAGVLGSRAAGLFRAGAERCLIFLFSYQQLILSLLNPPPPPPPPPPSLKCFASNDVYLLLQ
jgi:hypothetical protein